MRACILHANPPYGTHTQKKSLSFGLVQQQAIKKILFPAEKDTLFVLM